MKRKLVNKYDTYKRKEGTYAVGESMTDKSKAEEADIYKCIEKYGITTLMRQTMAQEPLYLDNTQNMTYAEAVNNRKNMDLYFENLPARVRKVFGDSSEEFYQKYKTGEFGDFLNTGVMTEEQVKAIKIAGGEYYDEFEEQTTTMDGNNNNDTVNNKSSEGNNTDNKTDV